MNDNANRSGSRVLRARTSLGPVKAATVDPIPVASFSSFKKKDVKRKYTKRGSASNLSNISSSKSSIPNSVSSTSLSAPNGTVVNKPKRGRPLGSKNAKKGVKRYGKVIGADCDGKNGLYSASLLTNNTAVTPTKEEEMELAEEVVIDTEEVMNFKSCLANFDVEVDMQNDSSPKGVRPILLRRALSIRELDDESWLSSSLIDLVISKFSKSYKTTHFMSIDFAVLSLSSLDRLDLEQATDIAGKRVDYANPHTPIVFVCNSKSIHWNLIRVIRHPRPELQLFEPMGKPENRHGGLGFRDVPRSVIQWLNICCPLKGGRSWLSVGRSAITKQQQFTPFDCGVACLLYAEKCGQGHNAAQINTYTTQENITEYRKVLQDFTKQVNSLDYDL